MSEFLHDSYLQKVKSSLAPKQPPVSGLGSSVNPDYCDKYLRNPFSMIVICDHKDPKLPTIDPFWITALHPGAIFPVNRFRPKPISLFIKTILKLALHLLPSG
jgi:hypothetical protein